MKKIIFFLFLCTSLFAQYNLSGLKSVKIEILDDYDCLDAFTRQKLYVETKIRLTSIGVLVDERDPVGALQFRIDLNRSTAFADPRVLLRIELLEKVQTFRPGATRTEAKTYSDASLQAMQKENISQNIYSFFMDRLFLEFVDKWLGDNPKQ